MNLNGKGYDRCGLEDLCIRQLNRADIPPHEAELYFFIRDWISDDLSVTLETSGSTGPPRKITVPKESLMTSAMISGLYFGLKRDDSALLCLPVRFIAGKMMVVRSFVLGMRLFTVEPSGNPLSDWNGAVDFAAMIPLQVHRAFNESMGADHLERIGTLIIGGGEISAQLAGKIRHLKNKTYQTYGMTETFTHVAVMRMNGPAPGNFFSALEGFTFEVDHRECLIVSAHNLPGGRVVTNDRVILQDPHHFRFLGRIDHVINSGGIKIHPEQIESKIEPLVDRAFLISSLPDDRLNEQVVLVMEGKPLETLKEQTLINLLKKKLHTYEIPRRLIYIDRLKYTFSGKIDRPGTQNFIRESFL
ncbi:MAG: AMP-binding protein [Bacteroidales bacterium]|nr:AMP-binding protein [Bacteroidales bacterium]